MNKNNLIYNQPQKINKTFNFLINKHHPAMTLLTPYEIKRNERVARNKAILAKLIENDPLHRAMMAKAAEEEEKKRKRQMERVENKKKRLLQNSNPEEVRRSGRIRNFPAPIYTTFERNEDLGDDARAFSGKRNLPSKKRKRTTTPSDDYKSAGGASRKRESSGPSSPQSLKALDAELKHVYSEFLGHRVETKDGGLKAAVVRELSPIQNPKFSKMSGIQEWKNCVVLYVNVGDKYGNSYDNVFTSCGGCITWFAQPRQDEESSPICTILSTYSKRALSCDEMKNLALAEDNETHDAKKFPNWPVHLFCRMEGETYTYCGRLKALKHEGNKRPIKFEMQLLDAPLLRTSQEFLELVELADGDIL